VADLSAPAAIGVSAAFIIGGWIVYDLLCRSPLGRHDRLFAAVLFVLVTALAWGLTHLFGGRGAYIHFGVVLGTIMVANVFHVIIPGQRRMVAALAHGEAIDPEDGIRGKQRSVHNTYFTLPVVFTMTSNHFALVYNHPYNWAILVAISLAGALIRVWFVARHKGASSPWPLVAAFALLAAAVAFVAPRSGASAAGGDVSFAAVRDVVHRRCTGCHSDTPTVAAFPAAPAGVVLQTDAQIRAAADRIHQQVVVTRIMPIGNLTGMTDAERELIDRWYRSIGEQ
jgi:uncharacterized membrane protein